MKTRATEGRLVHPAYRGVRLSPADAGAGWLLSVEAGWDQTEDDWGLMLRAGGGFGFESPEGALVASALLFPYGGRVAWISMVLVTASARRQGLATLLLRHALFRAEETGVRPMLDATPAGRDVYRGLGFRDLRPLTRWHRAGAHPAGVGGRPADPTVEIAAGPALEQWAAWDEPRFGASRRELIAAMRNSLPALARGFTGADGEPRGFCVARPGRTAVHLGPVVAAAEADALVLLQAALDRAPGPALIDLMDGAILLEEELARRGFQRQRNFTRMGREPAAPLGRPECLFAAAGAEFG